MFGDLGLVLEVPMQNWQTRLIGLGRDGLWVRNWQRQPFSRMDSERVFLGVDRLCRWEREDVHSVPERWQLVGVEEAEAPTEHFDGLLETFVDG